MLKKGISLILIVFIFACFNNDKPLFSDGKGYYTVTTGNGSSGSLRSFSSEEIYKFYTIKSVTGQSLATYDKNYIDDFLQKKECKKVFSEVLDGIEINYYYSSKISGYRSINGKKVNLQTCDDNGLYTIGSPLIYGGF